MGAFEDLALLRAFVAIVECGSISAGARRLRVSQPGLSRQLRALEENCGTVLLRRDTHRMNVTEAGQRLLDDAKSILAQAEEADRRLREGHTTLSGHLRLFATVDLGQSIVTRLVSQFLLDHPKVTATLALLVSGRLEWAGVAAGLATSAKYPGIVLAVPLPITQGIAPDSPEAKATRSESSGARAIVRARLFGRGRLLIWRRSGEAKPIANSGLATSPRSDTGLRWGTIPAKARISVNRKSAAVAASSLARRRTAAESQRSSSSTSNGRG